VDYSDVTEDLHSNGDVPDGTAQVLAADPGSATSVLSLSRMYEPLVAPAHADESATPGILPAGILGRALGRGRLAVDRRTGAEPPWRVLAAGVLGSLAVLLATALAIMSSSDVSATLVPAAVVAVPAWCCALHYVYLGRALPPLTLSTPVAAAVAGLIGLAGASAAVMVLPGIDVLHRAELLIIAGGIAIGCSLYELVQRRVAPRRRVLVVGAADGGAQLARELEAHRELPFECVGIIDDGPGANGSDALGTVDDLPVLIERERPDLIILAGVEDRGRVIQRIFDASTFRFRLVDVNHFYEDAFGSVPLHTVTPAWFMSLLHVHRRPYSRLSKRAFDLVVVAIAMVPVGLLVPFVALLVRCSGPGPIMFRQTRLGEAGRPFEIYKFRTMVADAERRGAVWASAADPRITPIGRFLRRARLDELPQLWNVLRGDMSIVGPRPERPEFLEQLASEVPFWTRRHVVKPGITGWAQLRCGYTDDSLGAAKKLSHDLYYLKHRSLLLDVAIAAKTAAIVVRGTGAH
jgi:exopolysaccharide biosynthesis polyprenyl glycosylphosphotransferase